MYQITPDQQKRLDQWHYHRANIQQTERFQMINDGTKSLASMLMTLCPPGNRLARALDLLEDVRMKANSAIVLDEE